MRRLGLAVLTFAALACGDDVSSDDASMPDGDMPDVVVVPDGFCPVEVTYRATDATPIVHVAGTFNDWDPGTLQLEKGDDGIFRATLELAPGKYEYKFVVDGTWIEDPANPESIDDPYGGKNSVLTVE